MNRKAKQKFIYKISGDYVFKKRFFSKCNSCQSVKEKNAMLELYWSDS